MARDPEIIDGILLWITARQTEALRNDRIDIFEVLETLRLDVEYSATTNEYPWEVILRAFNDRARKAERRNKG